MQGKRPLFQLHLSTCVVLMLWAGVLLWLNVVPRGPYLVQYALVEYWWAEFRGWPLHYQELDWHHVEPQYDRDLLERGDTRFINDYPKDWRGRPYVPERKDLLKPHFYGWLALLANSVFALIFLALLAFTCEWVTRRARRSCPQSEP